LTKQSYSLKQTFLALLQKCRSSR